MTNTDLVGFAENKSPELESYKSSEPESAGKFTNYPSLALDFGNPRVAIGRCRAKISIPRWIEYQKFL
jgi:hypothetical protein